ncbi:MAG: uroporphyrinogen-III synthase [Terriglobales bacterium]|jgi:uroporphyrinogen-III synthase
MKIASKQKTNRRQSKASATAPLSGLRVLVGRARHQASALSSGLRELGAEILEIPFIEIRPPQSYEPLDSALKNLPEYDWVILTSVNGVEAVWGRMRRLRLERKTLHHLQVAAIGPATRQAIEQHGVKVNVVPREYVAESVVTSLRRKVKGKRVLLARARVARDVIPRELRKLGARVDVVEAYETVVPRSSRQRLRRVLKSPKLRPDVIAFTSSSTVKNFVALLEKNRGRGRPRQTDGVRLASIGPVTSSTLRGLGLRVDVEARKYTIPGLVDAIVMHERRERRP